MKTKSIKAAPEKRENVHCGDLVNTRKGTGIVIGFYKQEALVAPTGMNGPLSSKVAYCET